MRSTIAVLVAGLLSLGASSPINQDHQPKIRELFEIPGVWIENSEFRPNGDLLLTTFNDGQLYSVDPIQPNPTPSIIAKVEGVSTLFGITKVGKDVFAVAGVNFNPAEVVFESGSVRIALIDFQDCESNNGVPFVRTILKDTDLGPVNGLTTLPLHKHLILGAVSQTGKVVRIDTTNGDVETVLDEELLTPGPNAQFPFGVNGLKIFKDYLYFTNTGRQYFARIKIDEFGNKAGDIEIIVQEPANVTLAPDDFSMDKVGNAYVAFRPDQVIKIAQDGSQTVIVNGTVAAPTRTIFGKDRRTLYVTTAGQGLDSVTGGQLVEVKL